MSLPHGVSHFRALQRVARLPLPLLGAPVVAAVECVAFSPALAAEPEVSPPTAPSARPQEGQLDADADIDADSDADSDVDTVIVIGSRLGSLDSQQGLLAGSRDRTARYELEDEHPTETFELFSKTPGVSLSRYNQGIVNTDIAIRGFAGDGTTPHAKLLIDGVPAHLHNGNGEIDQLFPLAIESIDVYKGTSDVRYGRFNTAGNYNVTSRSDLANEAQLTYGSFRTLEAQAYSGLELGPVDQSLFAGFRQTDGFRSHSETRKYSLSGRWSARLGEPRVTLIARLAGYEGDSPGYLDRETARRSPRSSTAYANQDGGEKEVRHLSLHLAQDWLSGALQLRARGYGQSFERTRWVRFSEEGALQEREDDQLQTGLGSTLAWLPARQWRLSVGFDFSNEDVVEQRFGTLGQTRRRDTDNVIRNYDYTLQNYGGLVSIENVLFDRIRWSAGLRLDSFDGDFESIDADGTRSPAEVNDFGVIVQPKFNVLARAGGGLSFFGNYGRSFQSPFSIAWYAVEGREQSSEVSVNDGWEAGVKWAPGLGLNLRLSYWEQRASNEFVSLDGVNSSVGETDRQGIETAAAWYATNSLYFWGNISWSFTEIVSPGDDALETIGNRLRSVPAFTTSLGARYDLNTHFFASVHADGQGSYYANEANLGGRLGDYFLVHADAGYQTRQHRIQLNVRNLLDSYYEYVFDFSEDGTSTIHSPGAGLNASVSYTLRL